MSETPALFRAGDAVLICGELPRLRGEVRWQCDERCLEHGDVMYRVRMIWPSGEITDVQLCESILAIPNEQ